MKFVASFILMLLSFNVIYSSNDEKIYLDVSAIYSIDTGFCFAYKNKWYFSSALEVDPQGPYIIKTGSTIFRIWWCNNCEKWISDDTEFCPTCGEAKYPVE